ncbi:hypothetical protein K1T71_009547 [Dendrolimus kikuchii]|uniref:Uncharacterized protein n=1 Tax=Dendrolimus kikuchii TaxID=765133 RepID=A0ACC1CRZ3_9NEOP|nr:hypothetical protein K1T71_009547 [Dendrolimus kikuchii]
MKTILRINNAESKPKKQKQISDILEVFGKYQIIQYTYVCFATIFITMIEINYIFVAGDMEYRCLIPECDDMNSTVKPPAWWPDEAIDRCSRPVLKEGNIEDACNKISFTNETEQCTEWIYENDNTVVAALNLACQPWKSNLIGTIHSVGVLSSMLLFGWVSDRIGRKPTFLICVIGSAVGQLKQFTTSYHLYAAIEYMEAAISGGSYAAAMVLMLEIGGKKNRVLSGVLFSYSIYMGESLFACIAMFAPYWKTIIRIIYSPFILFVSYIFLMYESPRWLIVNGKMDKAKKSLLRIARQNDININYEELEDMDSTKMKVKFNIEENEVRESMKKVFTSKQIIVRLLVSSMCRFTSSFVYYGLMINSVWLPGDKYVNFLLSTIMSFPGELICLYLMNKVGRKLPLMVGYVICGGLCLGSAYVPETYVWLKITLFLLGKMLISACFTGAITYSMELFPTSARGSLLGLGTFASRTGGMLAPLTPILHTVSPILPSVFFCLSSLLSGILLSFTPETKDLPLMDTVQQVEDSVKRAKEQKIMKKNTKDVNEIGL